MGLLLAHMKGVPRTFDRNCSSSVYSLCFDEANVSLKETIWENLDRTNFQSKRSKESKTPRGNDELRGNNKGWLIFIYFHALKRLRIETTTTFNSFKNEKCWLCAFNIWWAYDLPLVNNEYIRGQEFQSIFLIFRYYVLDIFGGTLRRKGK